MEVRDGDLLLLWDGSNAGEFFLGKSGVLSSTMVKLHFDVEEYNSKFLYYQLKAFETYLKSQTNGSGIPHVDRELLLGLEIKKFEKVEQIKIAGILSEMDDAIKKTEAIIEKNQRIKTGLIHDLLSKGIDKKGNIRTKATHKFAIKKEVEVPEEWDVSELGSLAQVTSGITLGKKYEGSKTVELPYLRVANVQDGFLDLSEVATIRIPSDQVSKYKLEIGDVLMNEGGDFDKLGRGTLWLGQLPICLHQNHVFKVRTYRQKLYPEFLEIVSQSPYGKRFFILSSKQSTNLASINSTQLKSFPVPLPDPAEQLRIVSIHKAIQEKVELLNASLNKLQSLRTGLMQDLLSGKVKVHE